MSNQRNADKDRESIATYRDCGYRKEMDKIAEHWLERAVAAEQRVALFISPGNSKNEVVHHINGIKNDNRPENLQVMTHKEHMELHNRTRKLQKEEQR